MPFNVFAKLEQPEKLEEPLQCMPSIQSPRFSTAHHSEPTRRPYKMQRRFMTAENLIPLRTLPTSPIASGDTSISCRFRGPSVLKNEYSFGIVSEGSSWNFVGDFVNQQAARYRTRHHVDKPNLKQHSNVSTSCSFRSVLSVNSDRETVNPDTLPSPLEWSPQVPNCKCSFFSWPFPKMFSACTEIRTDESCSNDYRPSRDAPSNYPFAELQIDRKRRLGCCAVSRSSVSRDVKHMVVPPDTPNWLQQRSDGSFGTPNFVDRRIFNVQRKRPFGTHLHDSLQTDLSRTSTSWSYERALLRMLELHDNWISPDGSVSKSKLLSVASSIKSRNVKRRICSDDTDDKKGELKDIVIALESFFGSFGMSVIRLAEKANGGNTLKSVRSSDSLRRRSEFLTELIELFMRRRALMSMKQVKLEDENRKLKAKLYVEKHLRLSVEAQNSFVKRRLKVLKTNAIRP